MARTLSEATITTKEARKRLPAGLHWRGIDPEVHLGYRKGKRGGVWLVRWRHDKGYRQAPIGVADDAIDEGTLDFNAAIRAAREMVKAKRAEEAATADGGSLATVASAVGDYTAARDARDSRRKGRDVKSDATSRLGLYVTGRAAKGKRKAVSPSPLAEVGLHVLDEGDLRKWLTSLPADMAETTKERLVNDLRAALNAAFEANRQRLPSTLPVIIKRGLQIDRNEDEAPSTARDNQILTDEQVSRLIAAAAEIDTANQWEGDLLRLVALLAATGARFSQAIRLTVNDVQPEKCRVMVPVSRKGRGKSGSTPVPIGKDVLKLILPAISGRKKNAPLLERWRVAPTWVSGAIQWKRVGRGPWKAASEMLRPWRSIVADAGLHDVIPYALRHSSIVRGIRANLPIRLVAALHDTSVQMIEKHYGRWIADGLDELASRAVVPLVGVEAPNNITRLTKRHRT